MKNKLLAMMFGAALVLGACGGGNDNAAKDDTGSNAGETPSGETSSVDAEAVVQKSCVGCHGGDLTGGAGPDISKAGANFSEEELHDIVVNGKGGMPPVLKGEEADAVAKYLADKK